MTRQDLLFKWFWYSMALLPIWLAEDLIFSRLHILGVSPMLLPLAAVAVAVLEGPVAGAGFGLAVGLLCDMAWLTQGRWMLLALTLSGAAVGAAAQYGLKQSFPGYLICSAGVLGAIDVFRILSYLLSGRAALAPLLRVALPEIFVSLLLAGPVYLLFRKVYSKVGGTRLM